MNAEARDASAMGHETRAKAREKGVKSGEAAAEARQARAKPGEMVAATRETTAKARESHGRSREMTIMACATGVEAHEAAAEAPGAEPVGPETDIPLDRVRISISGVRIRANNRPLRLAIAWPSPATVA
jgi:hypothetical protein